MSRTRGNSGEPPSTGVGGISDVAAEEVELDVQVGREQVLVAQQQRRNDAANGVQGWWQAYGDAVPDYLDLFVGLEAAASRLSMYEAELVPGLFQTEAYARTLITADHPEETEAEIERRVQLRLARQAILRRPIDPPTLQVAIRESVLRCPVGGPVVIAPQLDRLAEVSEFPYVSLRVLPFAAGFHLGMLSGAFFILRFPLNGGGLESEPPTVYSDLFTGALYLDKPHEVARYDRAFGEIWQASLDEDSSGSLIRQAAEEMRNG